MQGGRAFGLLCELTGQQPPTDRGDLGERFEQQRKQLHGFVLQVASVAGLDTAVVQALRSPAPMPSDESTEKRPGNMVSGKFWELHPHLARRA